MKSISLFITVLLATVAISQSDIKNDYLPSFNEGIVKSNIVKFVQNITDPANPNYVEPKDRIACFDNDGTLWAEQPLPNQTFFTIDRIKYLAQSDPTLRDKMPYSAIVNKGLEGLKDIKVEDVMKLAGKANAYDDENVFNQFVRDWIDTAHHPVLKRKIKNVVYQPMLELMEYLRLNDFKIYIVSGGSQEFMRPFAEELYDIPTERVIGSTFETKAVIDGDSLRVIQTEKFEFLDDHTGKAINIHKFIDKKPTIVVGNSDGDLEMMQYATTGKDNVLCIFLKHTDGEREFLYDDKVLYGGLKKGEEVAKRKGWTIIDMKRDWKKVF